MFNLPTASLVNASKQRMNFTKSLQSLPGNKNKKQTNKQQQIKKARAQEKTHSHFIKN